MGETMKTAEEIATEILGRHNPMPRDPTKLMGRPRWVETGRNTFKSEYAGLILMCRKSPSGAWEWAVWRTGVWGRNGLVTTWVEAANVCINIAEACEEESKHALKNIRSDTTRP